jgi:hypothetical protein
MKKTIALDVDGVLADYSHGWQGLDHIGEPIPGAVQFTHMLSEFADVLVYTTRCSEEMSGRNGLKAPMLKKLVQEWLDRHGFKYADIWVGQGKPIYSALVDDRAVACRPQEDGRAFEEALRRAKVLCGLLKEQES